MDGRAPRIVPTGAALGARVEDLDLRGLDTETFAFMYKAVRMCAFRSKYRSTTARAALGTEKSPPP